MTDGQRSLGTKSSDGLVIVAVLCLFAAFVIMAWPHLLSNWDSNEHDQGAFLGLGLDVKDGVRLTDGNRQPLLPLLLSSFASSEWSYFTSAKLLCLGISLLSLATLLFLGSKLFTLSIALLAVTLTAFNVDFLGTAATQVIAESLLTLFIIITLYFWLKGLRRNQSRFFALSGAAVGLAYLTKGTGQLMLVCFLFWALASGFLKRKWPAVVSFVIAYFVIISPLLVYNMRNWGTPFYNFNTSQAMWYDTWDDKYALSGADASLDSYLASHNIGDILERVVTGGILVINKRWEVLFPVYSLAILLVAVVILLVRWRGRQPMDERDGYIRMAGILIPVIVLLAWLLFFAWYAPISNRSRHFVVLLPLVNTAISILFFRSADTLNFRWLDRNRLQILCVTVILVSVYGSVNGIMELKKSNETWNVYVSDTQNNADLDELIHGLESFNEGTVRIINGPDRLIPRWRAANTTLAISSIPAEVNSMEKLLALMSQTGADYLIVHRQMIERRSFLNEYFTLTDERDFEMIKQIPNLSLMADYRVSRNRIMIFERL